LLALGLGLVTYITVILLIKNVNFADFLRYPAAVLSVLILIVNLVMAKATNGALNWIDIGPVSIQPSEPVKIAFILVGSVTLDRLLSSKSLTLYIAYSLACVGLLFLMRDFGTALIFFFTFILIAYMRSGDIRTIALICTGALMGAILIIYFKPYVANRFSAYRHVWQNADTIGYQQTRTLIYSSSGGLMGLGIGEGKLRNIFAASTDLVFGLICEELGIIIGVSVLLAFACIAVFAVRAAKGAASSFYAIAAVASAGMLLFQLALNVFGITDLLPLTGVTLPFISRGGSSMICSWGLLAFIRAAGAPFKLPSPDLAVSKQSRRKGGERA
ncbi:MAG: FtsW/RodA/SpoVE family cell cycle protein, partial [Clostridia bacterium]|nr:FtsW/RodA/SpoVE family cell cycle protein [Clostridia bacterium]